MTKLLIIDDDVEVLGMMVALFEHHGYEVLTASSGLGAQQHFRKVDLIITDIFMPDKDGLETIRDIRIACPDIAVIALSGGGSTLPGMDFLEQARVFGASATLQKPFSIKELLKVVEDNLAA